MIKFSICIFLHVRVQLDVLIHLAKFQSITNIRSHFILTSKDPKKFNTGRHYKTLFKQGLKCCTIEKELTSKAFKHFFCLHIWLALLNNFSFDIFEGNSCTPRNHTMASILVLRCTPTACQREQSPLHGGCGYDIAF